MAEKSHGRCQWHAGQIRKICKIVQKQINQGAICQPRFHIITASDQICIFFFFFTVWSVKIIPAWLFDSRRAWARVKGRGSRSTRWTGDKQQAKHGCRKKMLTLIKINEFLSIFPFSYIKCLINDQV